MSGNILSHFCGLSNSLPHMWRRLCSMYPITCNGVTYGVVPVPSGGSPVAASTNAPASTAAPTFASTPASIQLISYSSSSTACSGKIQGAVTLATDVCVPFSPGGGNSSILTRAGNGVTAQGYKDKACTIPDDIFNFPLNSCEKVDKIPIVVYAFTANTIPPSPYTTTTGQLTQTYA